MNVIYLEQAPLIGLGTEHLADQILYYYGFKNRQLEAAEISFIKASEYHPFNILSSSSSAIPW